MIKLSKQKVVPEWIDYNGHMNVAYYTLAIDHALDEYMTTNFGMDVAYIEKNKRGPFALQSSYSYLAELKLGEEFNVSVRILDCAPKFIHFYTEMNRSDDGSLCATSEFLTMNVNLANRRSEPFPEPIYQKIQQIHDSTRNDPIPEYVSKVIGIRRK